LKVHGGPFPDLWLKGSCKTIFHSKQNYYITCFDFFKSLDQKNVFFVERQDNKRFSPKKQVHQDADF